MRYMIAPLDLTTEELEIYKLLYKKMDFDTFEVKYTTDQLVADSNKKLELTFKKVYKILKDFEDNNYIYKLKRGSKGNPTTYKINQIREIKSNLKESYEEAKGNLKENNKEIKNEELQQFDDFQVNNKEIKSKLKVNNKEVKGKTKVNPINDKDIDKESIERVWKLYPKKTDKKKAVIKIANIIKNIGEEKLIECINNYEKYIQSTRNGKWIQSYMGGDKFFGGRYEDYLEELKVEKNYIKEEKKEVIYNPDSEFKNLSLDELKNKFANA